MIYGILQRILQDSEMLSVKSYKELNEIFEGQNELISQFMKAFIVHDRHEYWLELMAEMEKKPESESSDPQVSGSSGELVLNFEWAAFQEPFVSHRRIIAYGAFGEVHEINATNVMFANFRCTSPKHRR